MLLRRGLGDTTCAREADATFGMLRPSRMCSTFGRQCRLYTLSECNFGLGDFRAREEAPTKNADVSFLWVVAGPVLPVMGAPSLSAPSPVRGRVVNPQLAPREQGPTSVDVLQ